MRALVAVFALLFVLPPASRAGVFVGGPLPSEIGGFIESEGTYDAQRKLHKESLKLAAGIAKCYSKGAKNHTKGKASGVHACLHDAKRGVLVKYAAKTTALTAETTCFNGGVTGPTELGAAILQFTKSLNSDYLYCVSPSGAFLDPVDF